MSAAVWQLIAGLTALAAVPTCLMLLVGSIIPEAIATGVAITVLALVALASLVLLYNALVGLGGAS